MFRLTEMNSGKGDQSVGISRARACTDHKNVVQWNQVVMNSSPTHLGNQISGVLRALTSLYLNQSIKEFWTFLLYLMYVFLTLSNLESLIISKGVRKEYPEASILVKKGREWGLEKAAQRGTS